MTISEVDERNATGSLHGLRVLDFSTTIAGPHCTRMLADVGAEVIKIEAADGETMRIRPPVRNGCSSVFGQLNAGKKSIVLDLKSPEAIEVVRRLVKDVDILVENFRPGVMRRLKLDYASLQPLNPALHTGARPAHQSRELRGRSAAILLERQQQFLVNGIHGISSFYPCITSKYTLKMSEKTLSFAGGLNKNTRLISEAS